MRLVGLLGPILLLAFATPGLAAEVRIVTIPEGAEVWLEDVRLGTTGQDGLRLVGIATGTYKYSIRKARYSPAERTIQVQTADDTVTVVVRLQRRSDSTEDVPERPQAPASPRPPSAAPPETKEGGSKALPILLLGTAGAIGAGVTAVAATRQEEQANRAPTAQIVTTPEGTAVVLTTIVRLTAVGSDPDGDPVTYRWDFGDQALGVGESVTHVFPTVGTFRVSLTVSDGKTETISTRQVVVGNLVGSWKPSVSLRGETGYEIKATTPSLPGTVFFRDGSRVDLLSPRSIASDPRSVLLQYFDRRAGETCLVSLIGQADTSLRTIGGTVGCTGCAECRVVSITLIRQ